MLDMLADERPTSAARFFAPVHLCLTHLTVGNPRLPARLGQALAVLVQAGSERRGFEAIFAAMGAVIGGASLLHCLAVRRLGKRRSAKANDDDESDRQSTAGVLH